MTHEDAARKIKERLTEKITENYDCYFYEWISDPWHAEIPQLYVGVICSEVGSIREKFPGLVGDLSIKQIETMAENLCCAIESLISIYPNHDLDLILNFTNKMIDSQFNNNEIWMLFEDDNEEETENENPL